LEKKRGVIPLPLEKIPPTCPSLTPLSHTVLVVDDDTLRQALEDLGLTVDTADDGTSPMRIGRFR